LDLNKFLHEYLLEFYYYSICKKFYLIRNAISSSKFVNKYTKRDFT